MMLLGMQNAAARASSERADKLQESMPNRHVECEKTGAKFDKLEIG